MCCCCPPAINALFCLWFQSGCSKGTVAGALTFFPPDPPLYKFERYDKEGNVLGEHEEEKEQQTQEDHEVNDFAEGGDDDEDELMEIVGPTGHVESLEETANRQHSSKKNQSAAQQLLERQRDLVQRAKERNARDKQDAENGVTYKLALDPRLGRPPSAPGQVGAVKIPTKRGVYLAALVYRLPSDLTTPNTKTILYSHGNATDIGAMYALQVILVQSLQCNVVCYDYSGYGESGGVAMENNTYSDIKSVYQYCCRFTDPSNIVLYGQSVGSGPVCHLAYKNNAVGGMILHSPFTSGMRVLTPSRLLACLDIYPNINRIRHVRCPVMVIHGKLDEEVSYMHGVDMHNAVPREFQREPWWVPDRGHNDITDGHGKMAEYIRRLRRFMESLDEEVE